MKNIFYALLALLFPAFSVGQTETKKTVYFETALATLDKNTLTSLDSIARVLAAEPYFTITLTGHTDDVGSNEYNEKLAADRVTAVKNYLVSKKIDPARIISDRYGETKPIIQNTSKTNRALNRRVEIQISVPSPIVQRPPVVEQEASWPPANGIVAEYGTKIYDIPGSPLKTEITVISTTEEMQSGRFSTMTESDELLSSNLIVCVRRAPGVTECNLKTPVKVYLPVNTRNRYCTSQNVLFYDAQWDSLTNTVKWKEIPSDFTRETRNGVEYFVMTVTSLCGPCKNFDCPHPSSKEITMTFKSRSLEVTQLTTTYKSANSLFYGKRIRRNVYTIPAMQWDESPLLKLTVVARNKKNYELNILLDDLVQDKKGRYILTKKMLKKK